MIAAGPCRLLNDTNELGSDNTFTHELMAPAGRFLRDVAGGLDVSQGRSERAGKVGKLPPSRCISYFEKGEPLVVRGGEITAETSPLG